MSSYSIKVQIAADDLASLQAANEQILLVRRFLNAGSPVAWAVVPLAQNHVIAWNDDYSLFAGAGASLGKVVTVNSATVATMKSHYTYTGLGFSSPVPDGLLPPATVQIQNVDKASNAMGLAQTYSVDGVGVAQPVPVNVESVPANQYARFTASQSLWIYLASGTSTGMVVVAPTTAAMSPKAFSAALLVDFDTGAASQTVLYSAALGQFVASS
ncbi:MAG: hypothetical protein MEQ07_06955 [Aquimonas sp.]|nr:hypothetical protein [Aquimonas sp.]